MSDIVLISGSPSATSRSSALLKDLAVRFSQLGVESTFVAVRDLPPEDLIWARYDSAALKPSIDLVSRARAVVVATPVYKAAYCGTLKTFLDLLPQNALQGKVVLPIVTGGSPAHLLAIDYSLKPVLSALGATELLQGIYAVDDQVKVNPAGGLTLHEDIEKRMTASATLLVTAIKARGLAAIG
jgi:FMN reductase